MAVRAWPRDRRRPDGEQARRLRLPQVTGPLRYAPGAITARRPGTDHAIFLLGPRLASDR